MQQDYDFRHIPFLSIYFRKERKSKSHEDVPAFDCSIFNRLAFIICLFRRQALANRKRLHRKKGARHLLGQFVGK